MVINCAPFLSLFLAWSILGEKVKIARIVGLLVAFGGLTLMIVGGKAVEHRPAYTPTTLAYVALLLNPFCISAGTLAMRKMRKLNDSVVSIYMAILHFVVFLPICLLSRVNLGILS